MIIDPDRVNVFEYRSECQIIKKRIAHANNTSVYDSIKFFMDYNFYNIIQKDLSNVKVDIPDCCTNLLLDEL